MMIVAVAPSLIWPPKKPVARPGGRTADSVAVHDSTQQAEAIAPQPSPHPPIRPSVDTGRVVWVTSPLYRLGFSTRGGRLVSAELLQYRGDVTQTTRPV